MIQVSLAWGLQRRLHESGSARAGHCAKMIYHKEADRKAVCLMDDRVCVRWKLNRKWSNLESAGLPALFYRSFFSPRAAHIIPALGQRSGADLVT